MMRQYEKIRMEDRRKKRSSAFLTILRGLVDVDAPIRISFPSLLRFATMRSALALSFATPCYHGLYRLLLLRTPGPILASPLLPLKVCFGQLQACISAAVSSFGKTHRTIEWIAREETCKCHRVDLETQPVLGKGPRPMVSPLGVCDAATFGRQTDTQCLGLESAIRWDSPLGRTRSPRADCCP